MAGHQLKSCMEACVECMKACRAIAQLFRDMPDRAQCVRSCLDSRKPLSDLLL